MKFDEIMPALIAGNRVQRAWWGNMSMELDKENKCFSYVVKSASETRTFCIDRLLYDEILATDWVIISDVEDHK